MGEKIALQPAPFRDLERQARHLQWLLVGLVAIVALLPTAVFVTLEVRHLRTHARSDAQQMTLLLASHMRQGGSDLPVNSAQLTRHMEASGLVSLRLIGPGGAETLRLGEPGQALLATEAAVPWTFGTTRLGEVRVEADARPLLDRAARVLGIHLAAAALLALVIYRVPMRALRRAIGEAEETSAQLMHSEQLSAVGEMYAGLAHEINNPLSIILTRVRLLLVSAEELAVPADIVRDLAVIERHGQRIVDTISNLLAFARRAPFELAETDLNHVIVGALSFVERPFARQGIGINALLDPAPPALRVSADHLQQLFVNLLINARDAMPQGGTITLRTWHDRERVVAEVQDTGAGIAPELRQRIFDPFFTTKEVGKGTGLGLSVSYGIVKAHRGEIEVESTPGQGAVFRVALPLGGALRRKTARVLVTRRP